MSVVYGNTEVCAEVLPEGQRLHSIISEDWLFDDVSSIYKSRSDLRSDSLSDVLDDLDDVLSKDSDSSVDEFVFFKACDDVDSEVISLASYDSMKRARGLSRSSEKHFDSIMIMDSSSKFSSDGAVTPSSGVKSCPVLDIDSYSRSFVSSLAVCVQHPLLQQATVKPPYNITHEMGFKFHAQPQTGAYSCCILKEQPSSTGDPSLFHPQQSSSTQGR